MDGKSEFREIAIHEAVNDRRLRGSLEWLILGDTFEVSQKFLDDIDHEDILEDIAERYQIGRDGALKAQEICEQHIMQDIEQGRY